MKSYLFTGIKVFSIVFVLFCLSLTGLGNPKNIPFWAIFWAAFGFIIFTLIKRSDQNKRENKASNVSMPLFTTFRIITIVFMLFIMSMSGLGNSKNLIFFALFWIIVFFLMYLLIKRTEKGKRDEKAGSAFQQIMQIAGLILFVAILSVLGFIHGIVGYICWFLAFSLIIVGILMTIRKRQRHFELVETKPLQNTITSIILAIMATGLPLLMLVFGSIIPNGAGKSFGGVVLSLIGIVIYLGLMGLAILMINKWKDTLMNNALGYVLIIVAAILPGAVIMMVSKDAMSLAGVYSAALISLVLAFFALDKSIKIS
jgi:hypothetical protein